MSTTTESLPTWTTTPVTILPSPPSSSPVEVASLASNRAAKLSFMSAPGVVADVSVMDRFNASLRQARLRAATAHARRPWPLVFVVGQSPGPKPGAARVAHRPVHVKPEKLPAPRSISRLSTPHSLGFDPRVEPGAPLAHRPDEPHATSSASSRSSSTKRATSASATASTRNRRASRPASPSETLTARTMRLVVSAAARACSADSNSTSSSASSPAAERSAWAASRVARRSAADALGSVLGKPGSDGRDARRHRYGAPSGRDDWLAALSFLDGALGAVDLGGRHEHQEILEPSIDLRRRCPARGRIALVETPASTQVARAGETRCRFGSPRVEPGKPPAQHEHVVSLAEPELWPQADPYRVGPLQSLFDQVFAVHPEVELSELGERQRAPHLREIQTDHQVEVCRNGLGRLAQGRTGGRRWHPWRRTGRYAEDEPAERAHVIRSRRARARSHGLARR